MASASSSESLKEMEESEQMPSFGTESSDSLEIPSTEVNESDSQNVDDSQEQVVSQESEELPSQMTESEEMISQEIPEEVVSQEETPEEEMISQETPEEEVVSQEEEPASEEGVYQDVESQESEVASAADESLGVSSVEEPVKDKGVLDKASKTRTKYNRTKKRLATLDDSEKDAIRNEVITEFINVLKVSKRKASRKKFARRLNGLRNDFHQALNLLNGTSKRRPGRKSKKQLPSPILEEPLSVVETPVESAL